MCLQVEKTKLTRSSLMAQPAAPLPDMYEYTAARVQIPHGACTCLNKKNLNAFSGSTRNRAAAKVAI